MTMDCTAIQQALATYRPDRPLREARAPGAESTELGSRAPEVGAEPTRQEIAAHLADCSACRLVQHRDDETWRMLDDYVVPAPSIDLVAAVMARVAGDELAARRTASRARRSSWRASAAAAVLVIAAGAGLGGWLGLNARAPSQPAPVKDVWSDHAELLGAAPPGSLASAYASLERGEVEP